MRSEPGRSALPRWAPEGFWDVSGKRRTKVLDGGTQRVDAKNWGTGQNGRTTNNFNQQVGFDIQKWHSCCFHEVYQRPLGMGNVEHR